MCAALLVGVRRSGARCASGSPPSLLLSAAPQTPAPQNNQILSILLACFHGFYPGARPQRGRLRLLRLFLSGAPLVSCLVFP